MLVNCFISVPMLPVNTRFPDSMRACREIVDVGDIVLTALQWPKQKCWPCMVSYSCACMWLLMHSGLPLDTVKLFARRDRKIQNDDGLHLHAHICNGWSEPRNEYNYTEENSKKERGKRSKTNMGRLTRAMWGVLLSRRRSQLKPTCISISNFIPIHTWLFRRLKVSLSLTSPLRLTDRYSHLILIVIWSRHFHVFILARLRKLQDFFVKNLVLLKKVRRKTNTNCNHSPCSNGRSMFCPRF
jgi:hypothetical protein